MAEVKEGKSYDVPSLAPCNTKPSLWQTLAPPDMPVLELRLLGLLAQKIRDISFEAIIPSLAGCAAAPSLVDGRGSSVHAAPPLSENFFPTI